MEILDMDHILPCSGMLKISGLVRAMDILGQKELHHTVPLRGIITRKNIYDRTRVSTI